MIRQRAQSTATPRPVLGPAMARVPSIGSRVVQRGVASCQRCFVADTHLERDLYGTLYTLYTFMRL
jgi:hypothetical protein